VNTFNYSFAELKKRC